MVWKFKEGLFHLNIHVVVNRHITSTCTLKHCVLNLMSKIYTM